VWQHISVSRETLDERAINMTEAILEPELPIIDPHHHLWDRITLLPQLPPATHAFEAIIRQTPRYLLDELLADVGSGHNVIASVYVQCGSFYRGDGPEALKPVGETEFVRGVAAMSASGIYGPFRACAGIVGHANLGLGDAVAPVLDAHLAAGGARFRGIRHMMAHDPDPAVLGPLAHAAPGLCADPAVRAALRHFAIRGLSLDMWILEPQLAEVVDLTRAFPDVAMVLDHVGTPVGIAGYAGQRDARFAGWATQIRALAACLRIPTEAGRVFRREAGQHSDVEVGHGTDVKRATVPTRSGPPFRWQAGRGGGDIWDTCSGQQLRQKPHPLSKDGGADACQEIADHEAVTAHSASSLRRQLDARHRTRHGHRPYDRSTRT